jgi:tyrosine aminotransferase
MCFSVMASAEQNVLIPRPGFPAYETLLGAIGCEVRYYDVLADREWECDLEAMEQQIDEDTAFHSDEPFQSMRQQHDAPALAGYRRCR